MTEKTFGILKSGQGEADNLRGRDVDAQLKSVSLDPKVKAVLIQLAERSHVNTKAIAEMATMLDQMTNIMQGMTDIAHNLKQRTDVLVGMTAEQDDAPEDTSREHN